MRAPGLLVMRVPGLADVMHEVRRHHDDVRQDQPEGEEARTARAGAHELIVP